MRDRKRIERGRSKPALRPSLRLLAPALAVLIAGAGCANEPVDPLAGDPTRGPGGARMTVVQGEDYSLPSWVDPEPYSGYVGSRDLRRPAGSMRIENWWLPWAALEPERGVYDWTVVEEKLAAAAAGGYQLNMHLESITWGGGSEPLGIVVAQSVPAWVLDEFALTEADLINMGWEFDILVIPGWRPDIRDAFNELVRAFGARGYAESPQLAAAYIHAISPSRGEEFWMTQPALDRLERAHGFTPQVLDDWITSRFAAYADAFAGQTHKLVWVGKQGAWRYLSGGRYADLTLRLVHDAWDLGAGNRSSAIELFNEWLNEPALGQSVDDQGYLHTDESLPPFTSVRYFGDENEEYGDAWTWRFGSRDGEPVRYRFSMLRALQMRMRFLWTGEAAEAINPALSTYAALSFGKTVTTSPDAWAYLRETPSTAYETSAAVIRNFERWLVQRDVPGGMTVPAQRTFREFNAGGNYQGQPDTWYDDLARRTDTANDNPHICFDLDSRFRVNGPVQIKVEILDDSKAYWHLEYMGTDHRPAVTGEFHNIGDGKVKTVTFTVPDAAFLGGLEHGMDFRITCDGPGDVTVRWVRLIRLQQP